MRFPNPACTFSQTGGLQRAMAKEIIFVQVETRKNHKDSSFLYLTFRIFLFDLLLVEGSLHCCKGQRWQRLRNWGICSALMHWGSREVNACGSPCRWKELVPEVPSISQTREERETDIASHMEGDPGKPLIRSSEWPKNVLHCYVPQETPNHLCILISKDFSNSPYEKDYFIPEGFIF